MQTDVTSVPFSLQIWQDVWDPQLSLSRQVMQGSKLSMLFETITQHHLDSVETAIKMQLDS